MVVSCRSEGSKKKIGFCSRKVLENLCAVSYRLTRRLSIQVSFFLSLQDVKNKLKNTYDDLV
jgi:hypothetical protein